MTFGFQYGKFILVKNYGTQKSTTETLRFRFRKSLKKIAQNYYDISLEPST